MNESGEDIDVWHTLVGLMIHKFNLGEVVFDETDFKDFISRHPNSTILINPQADGVHVKIISQREATFLRYDGGSRH